MFKNMLMSLPKELVTDKLWDRFYSKCERDEETGCLIFKGEVCRKTGYGRFWYASPTSQKQQAHRFAMLLNGAVFNEEKPFALHQCPALRKDCVELEHLYIGSPQDNVDDSKADGTFSLITGSLPGRLQGEKNGNCRFTENEIHEIRRRIRRGHVLTEIAKDYDTSRKYISFIKHGLRWGQLPQRRDKSLGNFSTR